MSSTTQCAIVQTRQEKGNICGKSMDMLIEKQPVW